MTVLALDSSAVLTWLLQEPNWKAVDAVLNFPGVDPFLPSPGLAEVVWQARRKGNVSSGEQILDTLTAVGVVVEPLEPHDALRAAELLELSAALPGGTNARNGLPITLSLG